MQACPFCGAPETDRLELAGERFLVFRCQFTPRVSPTASEDEIARELAETYRAGTGPAYFRGMCDRLHLFVAKGEGARVLTGGSR